MTFNYQSLVLVESGKMEVGFMVRHIRAVQLALTLEYSVRYFLCFVFFR
ncbi:MAG: hypothetical protein ACI96W_003901 [Paraglaciecola sp.]|jgi:hypothetical protein